MMRISRLVSLAAALAGTVVALSAQSVSGIFFTETWESGTTAGSFNSAHYGAGGSQFRLQNAVSASGQWGWQHLLMQGTDPAAIQYATQHFGDSLAGPVHPTGQGQHFYDLYVQYKIYYSPGFDFSNLYKQVIIGTQDDRRHDNVCCNPWVSHYMTIYPPGHALLAEANNKQGPNSQWVGFSQNQSGHGPGNLLRFQSQRWYTVEVRRRLNDPGVDNGIFQMWVDGVLLSEHRNVRYRVPWNGTYGANFNYGTNFVMVSDYGPAPPQDQSTYYDDFKFSTTYIGVGAQPPAPPTNLRVIR